MNTLDLTFRGARLPGHSLGQLKLNLARFFCIDDDAVIDALFSGDMVYLRCDLDRKTAADYFREITEMGGVAVICPSSQRHLNAHAVLLKQNKGEPARLIPLCEDVDETGEDSRNAPGGCDNVWAVRSKHIQSTAAAGGAHKSGVKNALVDAKKLEYTRANLILTSTGKELARLELKAADTLADSVSEISSLRREHAAAEKASSIELEQLAKIRISVTCQAEADIAALENELRAVQRKTEEEISELSARHAGTSEQEDARYRMAADVAGLRTRQAGVREALANELASLDQHEKAIAYRTEESEISMENACAALRERTEATLSKLRSLEEMLKERQDEALAELRTASNDISHQQTG